MTWRAPSVHRVDVTGRYAGPISRAIALALDITISGAAFALGSSAAIWTINTVVGVELKDRTGPLWLALLLAWLFLYYWLGYTTVGKTVGMAVTGMRVVARNGAVLSPTRAAVRVLALPLSVSFLGIGLIGAFLGRERRTFHDVMAGSVVIYDWGGREARLPSLLSSIIADQAVAPSRSLDSDAETNTDT